MTTQAPPAPRRRLAEIDVRGADTTRQLGRILPAAQGGAPRVSTFNSAL